ncbi:MAG: YlxR family protein [Clostridia bacterium]|nr:YlxR family protein [Clostridia bacterium]
MKKTPLRMCIACRSELPKKEMLRIVRDKQGNISLDFTGKAAGRGAYICDNPDCIAKCVKNKLVGKALDVSVSEDTYIAIKEAYDKKQS